MGYRLNPRKSVRDGVRRVVREQIDRAVRELSDPELSPAIAVHQARKRFKKLRAVLRLVRSGLGRVSRRENAFFRDVGRQLASVREADVLIETFDRLVWPFIDQTDSATTSIVRTALVERRDAIAGRHDDLGRRMQEVVAELHEARERVGTWPFDKEGFAAIGPGFRDTYDRGRLAFARACKERTAEQFHEWRKWVKYHWYHVRLLEKVWPALMKARQESLKELAERLGEEHDLSVFQQTLRNEESVCPDPRTRDVLIDCADRRRADLQAEAESLGRRLFAEKPRWLTRAIQHYWKAARSRPSGAAR